MPNRGERDKVPTNGAPEDLGGGTEVDGTMRRLGVHAFAKESHVLHLLSNKSARHANFLASDYDYFLAIKQLLGHD